MAASSRRPSPSPSLAPSQLASSYDIWTPFDCLPAQISNSRKRPSLAQLQRLQTAFDTSRYITKEERNALAHELGLDVKFITVWFQNRRQSDKRKAWTKRDRAKKKENSCQQIDTVFLKSTISLDQIASRKERVQRPAPLDNDKGCAVLSPKKLGNLLEPQTPTQSKKNTLWAHMPSSPPEAPSSPPSDALQFLHAPSLWACANARVGSKHRLEKDKRIQPNKSQTHIFCKPLAAPEEFFEGDSDDEDQSVEASTLSSTEAQPSELGNKSTEDVEAAMVLLQFLQG
ncbi:homeobox domain-containing protein [Russula compacta]|nr:homeobox domain-containing protein [Russula compacta]